MEAAEGTPVGIGTAFRDFFGRLVNLILAPVTAFMVGVAEGVASYKARHIQIDERSKCPACGDLEIKRMNVVLVMNGDLKVQLACLRCSAEFYFDPIVPADKWRPRVVIPQQGQRR